MPAQWPSSLCVRFAVSGLRVHFPCRVIPKFFKKMVFMVFHLGAQHKRNSVEKDASIFMWYQMIGPSSLCAVVVPSPSKKGWSQEGHPIVKTFSKSEIKMEAQQNGETG